MCGIQYGAVVHVNLSSRQAPSKIIKEIDVLGDTSHRVAGSDCEGRLESPVRGCRHRYVAGGRMHGDELVVDVVVVVVVVVRGW